MVINTIIHRDSSELKVHTVANHKIYHYCTVAPKIFLRSCAPKLLKASDFLVNVIGMLIIFQNFQSIVIFSNIYSRYVWQLSARVLIWLEFQLEGDHFTFTYIKINKNIISPFSCNSSQLSNRADICHNLTIIFWVLKDFTLYASVDLRKISRL